MTGDNDLLVRSRMITGEFGCLLVAYVACLGSAIVSLRTGDGSWFARSGSLMVLLAAVAEYWNFGVTQKLNERAVEATKYYNATPEKWRVPTKRRFVHGALVFTLIAGTLIWGYGDLLFSHT